MAASAVWTDVILASQTIVQGLGLKYTPPGGSETALPGAQVYRRRIIVDRDTILPYIMLAQGGRERLQKGDMEDTEIVYPVMLVHAFAANQSYAPNNDELLWRQLIIDAFIDQPRPEVTSAQVWDCQIDPDPEIDLSTWQNKNIAAGALLLQFSTLRSRNRP